MARVFVFGVPEDDAEGFFDYVISIAKGYASIKYVKAKGDSEERLLERLKGDNIVIRTQLLKPTPLGFEPQLSAEFFRQAKINIIIFLEFYFTPRESRELHGDVEIIKRNPYDIEVIKKLESEANANKSYAAACSAASKALFKSIRVNKANIKEGIEEAEAFLKGVF